MSKILGLIQEEKPLTGSRKEETVKAFYRLRSKGETIEAHSKELLKKIKVAETSQVSKTMLHATSS